MSNSEGSDAGKNLKPDEKISGDKSAHEPEKRFQTAGDRLVRRRVREILEGDVRIQKIQEGLKSVAAETHNVRLNITKKTERLRNLWNEIGELAPKLRDLHEQEKVLASIRQKEECRLHGAEVAATARVRRQLGLTDEFYDLSE